MIKRVFLIVLDSCGIGELPDAAQYGDVGSNTLKSCSTSSKFSTPNMAKLGLFNIDGVDFCKPEPRPTGCFGKLAEKSRGKDTTIGHWEIAGIVSEKPLPTYPNGFPKEVLDEFEKRTGRKVLCNKPYSGTEVIKDYGKEAVETGALIVYTSADSVFQIAAHEDYVPVEKLYEYCRIAREILTGDHSVGRVIARPFTGEWPYVRTSNRHDFSLEPYGVTTLDSLKKAGYDTVSVGKIVDIFAGRGITDFVRIKNNMDGMDKTIDIAKNKDFNGLCFVNLVDFDMVYGHRNDVDGYANALTEFDVRLGQLQKAMRDGDVVMITADHGCDPATPSTDHSREYIPFLVFGTDVKSGVNIGVRSCFSDINATVLDIFGVKNEGAGESFLEEIRK